MQSTSLIYMSDLNGLIGVNGKQPYYINKDLKHFAEITRNSLVVMGKRTYEDIIRRKGKPLLNRTTVVLTSNHRYEPEYKDKEPTATVYTAHSIAGVYTLSKELNLPIYVVGGKELFEQFEELASTIYHTRVSSYFNIDDIDNAEFKYYTPDWDKFYLHKTSNVMEFIDDKGNTNLYEFMVWKREF